MTFDEFYTSCRSNGLTPYFILDYGNSLYGGNGFNTGWTTQALQQGYANFAAAAVAHFKAMGGGVIWQIYQEPNLSQYFDGTATDYMNLVKARRAVDARGRSDRYDSRSLDLGERGQQPNVRGDVPLAGLDQHCRQLSRRRGRRTRLSQLTATVPPPTWRPPRIPIRPRCRIISRFAI